MAVGMHVMPLHRLVILSLSLLQWAQPKWFIRHLEKYS